MDTANRTNFPDRLTLFRPIGAIRAIIWKPASAQFYVVCVCVGIVPFVFVLGFCALFCVNVRDRVIVRVHVPVHITVAFVRTRVKDARTYRT